MGAIFRNGTTKCIQIQYTDTDMPITDIKNVDGNVQERSKRATLCIRIPRESL